MINILFTPLTKSEVVKEFVLRQDKVKATKIGFVVDGDPLLVGSFDTLDKKVIILAIPASTYVLIYGNYGWYPLGSAYELGQLEHPPRGGLILLKTISELIGAPIDYYLKSETPISTDENAIISYKQKLSGVSGVFLVFRAPTWIKNNLDTNLTLYQIYNLWWRLMLVRRSSIEYINIGPDILEELLLADGSKGYALRSDQLDLISEKIFKDSRIQKESVSIEILNSTASNGLAASTQRLLENIGCSVVNTGNYKTPLDRSVLVVNNPLQANSYTAKRLANILNLETKEALLDDSTADLTIILGNDKL